MLNPKRQTDSAGTSEHIGYYRKIGILDIFKEKRLPPIGAFGFCIGYFTDPDTRRDFFSDEFYFPGFIEYIQKIR
jgi:hypothetical protein